MLFGKKSHFKMTFLKKSSKFFKNIKILIFFVKSLESLVPHVFTVKNRSPDEKRSKIFTFNEKNVHFMCLKTTMKVTKWQKMAVFSLLEL